jgi:hypothetical protein
MPKEDSVKRYRELIDAAADKAKAFLRRKDAEKKKKEEGKKDGAK